MFRETIRTARDREISPIEVDAMCSTGVVTDRVEFRAAEEQLTLLLPT